MKQDFKTPGDSDHFWTEDGNHGTKTKVHVLVKNTGTNPAEFSIREDVKGYADWWSWSSESGQWCDHGAIVRILPGETKEFDVVTNETQGALNGHVRGVYVDSFNWWDLLLYDNVAQHLGKGDRVMIRGTLQERAYKKRDGSDGISLDLLADVVAKVIPNKRTETAEAF